MDILTEFFLAFSKQKFGLEKEHTANIKLETIRKVLDKNAYPQVYKWNDKAESRQDKGWVAGKLAAEFHRTPCIMAISGATHLDWLNSIGYTLTFLPGMLLLLSTDASVSVCSQMSSKLRQEPFCFLAQSSREVSTQLNILEISTLQGQLVCYP